MSARKNQVYSIVAYFKYPDGTQKKAVSCYDVFGEKKITYHMDETNRKEFELKMQKGMGERLSTLYNSGDLDPHQIV